LLNVLSLADRLGVVKTLVLSTASYFPNIATALLFPHIRATPA